MKVIWSRRNSYYSKARIWLPIWLRWTSSLYLSPFSRYSISKFSGIDLDLWPLKVLWGRRNSYHSKAHIWLPIWLPWTPAHYLLPFMRYSTSKCSGFDLDLWPLEVIWGRKKFIPFGCPYVTPYSTSMDTISLSRTVLEIFDFKIFRVWPWPLTSERHLGSTDFMIFGSPYMTSYSTSVDTISLSRTVFEINDFNVFIVRP